MKYVSLILIFCVLWSCKSEPTKTETVKVYETVDPINEPVQEENIIVPEQKSVLTPEQYQLWNPEAKIIICFVPNIDDTATIARIDVLREFSEKNDFELHQHISDELTGLIPIEGDIFLNISNLLTAKQSGAILLAGNKTLEISFKASVSAIYANLDKFHNGK